MSQHVNVFLYVTYTELKHEVNNEAALPSGLNQISVSNTNRFIYQLASLNKNHSTLFTIYTHVIIHMQFFI